MVGDTFLLLENAHFEPVPFVLPAHRARVRWDLVLDTRAWDFHPRGQGFRAGDQYPLEGRSIAVLRLRPSRMRG
jgi:glycogen operon protein